ncbi:MULTISPECIES: DUF1652 domain-containing protein [Pseudomonas]|uniref:DUF1652 domain-containing protein n=1 Tax=Pseudomonas juntendi TaxID=2666183 RepID=A0A7W2QV47_9PSED|nr:MULTISPECIES: DUF1652 domain-containing protein [Pseudomonas]OAK63899.1 hypothetical protein A3K88_11060 [Pseudomonas putida]PPB16993.1 DUF1652 domain-containing protein [Pseudomonas aeruginosa]MBA6143984.1 DUF1652 domain-containing protein [Pseudomonas juntendi]MCL8329841.1 DUF1652 domain-containing protein [Pseudomonas juntendi]QEQ88205.1 DUF1652 domain-containing protein [Pseudomonas putida]
MSLIGVSMLELRQLIEHACLPDRCEISCTDGANLTIRLGQGQSLDECCTLSGVPLRSLNSCRDVLNLVEQLHTLRDRAPAPLKSIA